MQIELVNAVFNALAIDIKSNNFVMLIKRKDTNGQVPIWIGHFEAWSIAVALAGIKSPRPQTHDLLLDVIHAIGAALEKIVITGIRESTYFALLYITKGIETYVVDSRPSDAVALALREGCPIELSADIYSFNLDSPSTPEEKQLSQQIRQIDPNELLGM